MRNLIALALTAALGAGASAQTTAPAATDKDHTAHHPAAAAKPSPKPVGAAPAAPANPMGGMMKSMQAMHEKMRAAQTPEERQALMAEHMKLMQDGMAMMSQMRGTGGGAGMGAGMNHDAMHQRVDMMEMMMQMMVDREAARSSSR